MNDLKELLKYLSEDARDLFDDLRFRAEDLLRQPLQVASLTVALLLLAGSLHGMHHAQPAHASGNVCGNASASRQHLPRRLQCTLRSLQAASRRHTSRIACLLSL